MTICLNSMRTRSSTPNGFEPVCIVVDSSESDKDMDERNLRGSRTDDSDGDVVPKGQGYHVQANGIDNDYDLDGHD